MNKRTDNGELLEDVLSDEAGNSLREASLESILRLARRKRRTRLIRRVGVVVALLLVSTIGAMRYLAPKAQPEVAQLKPSVPGFALITSQPLTPAEIVTNYPLSAEQIVAAPESPNIVHTVAGNYREVGDDELLALAAPQIVALVRRGPHEAELVFVPAQSNPQEN